MESSHSIKTNVAWNMLYQIVTVLVPLLTQPYLSRTLGAASIGIYSHTTASMTYFSLFATLGTATYGVREIARERSNPQMRTRLFLEIELLTVITSLISIVAWGIFILLNGPEYRICYIILTLELFSMMFDITWFYNGIERFRSTSLKSTIVRISYAIATVLFVKKPSDIYLYMLILSIASVTGNISLWFGLPRYLVRIDKKMLRSLRVFRHFKQTFIFFIPTIANSLSGLIDRTLIHVITGSDAENGYYDQASKILNLLEAVSFISLNNVLASHNSMLYKKGNKKAIRYRLHKSADFILALGYGILFGMPAVAPRFVPFFFGEGWNSVIPLLQIFSPMMLIVGISNMLARQYYTPAGKQKMSAWFVIIGSIVNITGDALLIPHIGTAGACIATVAGELLITILYLIYDDGFLTARKLIYLSWRKIIAGLVMWLYIDLVNGLIANDALAFIIEFVGAVAIYAIMLKVLHDPFAKTLKMILKRIKARLVHA